MCLARILTGGTETHEKGGRKAALLRLGRPGHDGGASPDHPPLGDAVSPTPRRCDARSM